MEILHLLLILSLESKMELSQVCNGKINVLIKFVDLRTAKKFHTSGQTILRLKQIVSLVNVQTLKVIESAILKYMLHGLVMM